MWKANLNRHFAKILPGLKISAFVVIWNSLFHSLTLSILIYGSLHSTQVTAASRLSSLNQFLSENQILFATLCSAFATFFFRDRLARYWTFRNQGLPLFFQGISRGVGLGLALLIALILHHEYDFLGFTTQLNLNFLASYAWILRALLIFVFVISTEFLVQGVLHEQLKDRAAKMIIGDLTLLFIYWIWFNPKPTEMLTLILLFQYFSSFWASSGFLGAFFVLTHAIFGLNFFENEFSGIFQIKAVKPDEDFLQNPHLQIALFIFLIILHHDKLKFRKEIPQT